MAMCYIKVRKMMGWTDVRTNGCQTITLSLPLDAASAVSVIWLSLNYLLALECTATKIVSTKQ